MPTTGANVATATIAAGQSLSGQVNLVPQIVHGFIIPSNWTAADITFQVSPDGGTTWYELNTSTNAAVDYPVTAGKCFTVDPTLWRAVSAIKIRSGTAASPVNQTQSVTISVLLQTLF